MPTYFTQPFLQKLQVQVEELLDVAISQWQMIPHSQFAKRPAAGAWSANECLQHLNSYGLYYLPAIEKVLQAHGTQPQARFKAGWLGHYFTELMRPSDNGKVRKMKAPKDHRPAVIKPSHEVISEFIAQHEKMLQLLRTASNADIGKIRVPISISPMIRLKLGDTFHFLIVHEFRHIEQAKRALSAAGVAIDGASIAK